jgi:hydrogenase maturation protein HypF
MGERVLIEVRGMVQGVGFRPCVHALATALELRGLVQNRGSHLVIDVEGESRALDTFLKRLPSSAPPLAAIDRIDSRPAPLVHHDRFAIVGSDAATDADVRIPPDVATCDCCLRELFDPANRRFRYPFITCSDCGPRFTIVSDMPYDRSRTAMAQFHMCSECQREYDDPRNRRFHAQTIACPRCGPALRAREANVVESDSETALAMAVGALVCGRIVAIKGVGGYHLACDATNEDAVATLRRRKRGDPKPFAIMLPTALAKALLGRPELRTALMSPMRPVVLVDREAWLLTAAPRIASQVAPACPAIGVMLPYTPLHHLLLHDVGRPLVMTSGNSTDDPIAYQDDDALIRLGDIADLFLIHDRQILTRCDDSVVHVIAKASSCVRRSRGLTPAPITLAENIPMPVLALGGQLKNAFCLAAGHCTYVSHHIGDLDSVAAYGSLVESIDRYSRLLGIEPRVVAHDLHPGYLSTRLANELSMERRLPVQHHEAHVLSCAAEHGVTEPVIGVAFDGAGLGTDGAIWGGEFFLADGASVTRLAHLGYVPLPGGDAAAREPWRMAQAHLTAAYGRNLDGVSTSIIGRIPVRVLSVIRQMIASGVGSPPTSSVGRLFDAVAALIGLSDRNSFEGQAAMELEAIATGSTSRSYRFEVATSSVPWTVRAEAVIRAIVDDITGGRVPRDIAAAFHEAVAMMIADVCTRISRQVGVALSGGVFQNARLTERAATALVQAGMDVLIHRRVPCNDGGLALGQAILAGRRVAASVA